MLDQFQKQIVRDGENGSALPDQLGRVAGFPSGDRNCVFHSLGLIPYQAAWDLQQRLVEQRKAREIEDTVLFLEHPPVITLGRNARLEHLLTPPETLRQIGIELVETDRGGDVTFHGPGQLMGYLILDLHLIRMDVVWYVRTLEEALIRTAREFGLPAERKIGFPGVWVKESKVAAIGVHLSRWVTSHGFALNLETDLRFFRHIVPCGIAPPCGVTSFREWLGRRVDRFAVERSLVRHLGELFGLARNEAQPGRADRRERCQPTC